MRRKNYLLFLVIFAFGSAVLALDYMSMDLLKYYRSIAKPTALKMDVNNKISILFENKLYLDEQEIAMMPLSTIVGDGGNIGFQTMNGKDIVYSVKAFKTRDCKDDEVYAEFTFGEVIDKKRRVYGSVYTKLRNRTQSEMIVDIKGTGEHLRLMTTPYFGPPKEDKVKEKVSLVPTDTIPGRTLPDDAPKDVTIYRVNVKHMEPGRNSSASLVIKNQTVGKIKQATTNAQNVEKNSEMTMKVSKLTGETVRLEFYYTIDQKGEKQRYLIEKEVPIDAETKFIDNALAITVAEYK